MSFYQIIERYRSFDFAAYHASVTERKIAAILERDRLTELEYLALLSDAAQPSIEFMAQKAGVLTRRHFGNAIFIFTPFYLSNYCDSVCPYCSFGRQQPIERQHLSIDEVRAEAKRIGEKGIRHILALTGESRHKATPAYCAAAVEAMRDVFSSIGVEIYPMTEEEYRGLIERGVDGLTIFQETYDEERYHALHQGGPKDNYRFRLDAPERAARQGIRTVSVGALLGLNDPRIDSFFTGLHAAWLQSAFPSVEVSIAVPRLRPLVAEFVPAYGVSDRRLAQTIVASRLFLPSAGITLTTRENAVFRNAAARFGVTRMSAGVSTAVPGHAGGDATPQFEIADRRSVAEVKEDLRRIGLQPVMHDWNGALTRNYPSAA
jgi:2-iminoacetate synthase